MRTSDKKRREVDKHRDASGAMMGVRVKNAERETQTDALNGWAKLYRRTRAQQINAPISDRLHEHAGMTLPFLCPEACGLTRDCRR